MRDVLTPDGWGQVLRSESSRGITSYLVKGAGFEGWYDGLQVTSDFAEVHDYDYVNKDNETTLPYPSMPQGPGKDLSTSSIPPDVDADVDYGHASDSLTGEETGEDPVEADIEGLFEPHSRLSSAPRHRLHFAGSDGPILDISRIPEESPNGLENSPINPDGVDTDDLFDGDNGFERQSSYDRLVIEDELSFLKFASDNDDDNKREQGEDPKDYDDDSEDDDDSDDDSDDSDSSDSDSDGDSGGDGDSGDGGGSHTASAFALTTTADLHFLANFCNCAAVLPLHSKSEHRELVVEAGLKDRRKKNKPLGSKPLTGHHGEHNPKTPAEAGYTGKGVAEALKKPKAKRGGEGKWGVKHRKVDRPIQYAAAENANGVLPQERDLDDLLERYQQEQHTYQESNLDNLVDHSLDDEDNADLWNHYSSVQHIAEEDGYDKYIGSNGDGTYHLIASGGGKLPKGKQYGHYDSYQDAHDAVEAIIAKNHSRRSSKVAGDSGVHAPYRIVERGGRWHVVNAKGESKEEKGYSSKEEARQHQKALYANVPGAAEMAKQAAPAAQQDAQPTQIESQIEQLMQFWAVDNNSWWHWTGSQADLALLNQMQQQMMAVGMPGGPPGQMQAQSAALPPKRCRWPQPEMPEGFQIEANAPTEWREYLQVVASDKLVALAAWKDVVEKSKRLRSEGAIKVEAFRPDVITAYVQGDNGRYYTTVQRLGSVQGLGRQGLTSAQVSGWSCECDWGHWAWLRKRSFVGRMCSHAYALFSEMRSLDAKQRREKGKPGRFASVSNKTNWSRVNNGFAWVSDNPMVPTAMVAKIASGWEARAWSDGTSEDSLSLGSFKHSEQARRAVARLVSAHLKVAEDGDVDVVGGAFPPYGDTDSISGRGGTESPYSEDGEPESVIPQDQQGSTGIEEGRTRVGFSLFGASDDGQDDEGPESEDDGIEEAEPDDEESLDEEIAEDTDDSDSGDEDEGDEASTEDDGGHDEPHKRDESDEEGTENPGDESDDDGIEKQSATNLQDRYGLNYLAGANYSLAEQDRLVREAEGKTARNRGNLNLTGTHYEAAKTSGADDAEDVLAFLF
ncbi:MAG TPA: hypothetical protein VIY48_03875 [Candidatus Paceibacterota bacterium]